MFGNFIQGEEPETRKALGDKPGNNRCQATTEDPPYANHNTRGGRHQFGRHGFGPDGAGRKPNQAEHAEKGYCQIQEKRPAKPANRENTMMAGISTLRRPKRSRRVTNGKTAARADNQAVRPVSLGDRSIPSKSPLKRSAIRWNPPAILLSTSPLPAWRDSYRRWL